MKVVLIQPRVSARSSYMPLGIGYVGAVLEKLGHDVALIDMEAEDLSLEDLRIQVDGSSPEIIGITTTIMSMTQAKAIGDLFSDYPLIVYGGPQASLTPEYFIRRRNEIVVRGEGEIIIANLIKKFETNQGYLGIKGISFKNNHDKIEHNPEEDYISDLDSIPFPARHLFNSKLYRKRLNGRKAANFMATRGCPFKCIYCYHILNRKFRTRNHENILSEINMLKNEYGVSGIYFYDDNLTLNRKWLTGLCQKLISREVDIKWRCLSSIKTIDKEFLKLMKDAGCVEIAFGVESGNQKTLDRIPKQIKVEDSRRVLRDCRDIGIRSKAYVMIGFPWETKEDIRTSISFVEETIPNIVQFLIVTPYPNTELWKTIVDMGYKIEGVEDIGKDVGNFEKLAKSQATDLVKPTYETENFTKRELSQLHDEAYRRYEKAKRKYVYKHPFSLHSRHYFHHRAKRAFPTFLKPLGRRVRDGISL